MRENAPSVEGLLRRAWYALFRHHPYYYAGALQWAAMRGDETQRLRRAFELFRREPLALRTLALRVYIDKLYYDRHSNAAAVPGPNRLRWTEPLGTDYHEELLRHYQARPEEFERDHAPILARTRELLREAAFEYVVEVGCGNGLLMERLAEHGAAAGTTFVGLDISAETIERTRQRWPGSRVQYHCCDTLQDFLGRVRPTSTLILANGTVQHFTQRELSGCLQWLVENVARGAVVVKDFTYPDGRLESQSRPAGGFSFYHNYEYLLAEAGLRDIRTQVYEARPTWKGVVVSARWGREARGGAV
ncbi:MAG TPA: class I SAM-dependent methyltransferase [Candidatus Xenobia bacterium]|nr:class I SAM-dependent methyltransferase [Candidatus Xenobia bacterium]